MLCAECILKTIVNDLEPCLREMLPNAFEIIGSSDLTIHEAVYAVVLEGSRGLRGGFRPDSDIDLSLLIDTETLVKSDDRGALLKNVIDVTLSSWKSPYELDTAAVFDKGGCGLNLLQT